MQNQSQTGRQTLYPDPLLLPSSVRPSLEDQKETQKLPGTLPGRAGSRDLSFLWLQQILGRNLQAWPSGALRLPRCWCPPPAGAVLVRALLLPHPALAGKFKVSWQQEAPLLHPPLCTPALGAYQGAAASELPVNSSARLLGWELDPRHEALLPPAPGSLRCALLRRHALVFLLSRYFSSLNAPLSIPCLFPPFLSIPKYIAHWQ